MSAENQCNRICRTCLTQEFSNNTSNSLYTSIDLENGESLEIFKIIENCINLEVRNADRLPQIICNKCTMMIRNFYVFRDKCHKNDTFLRNQLDTWKLKCEIKIEDAVENVLEVQMGSFEESKIIEFPEIYATGPKESFGNTDNENKSEIDIFENCPGDRIYDESSNDFSENDKDFVLSEGRILENMKSFNKYPNTRGKTKQRKTDDGEQQNIYHKYESTVDILKPTKKSSTTRVRTKRFSHDSDGENDQNEQKNIFYKYESTGDIPKPFKMSSKQTKICNAAEKTVENQQNISHKQDSTVTISKPSKKSSTSKIDIKMCIPGPDGVHDREEQLKLFYKCDICFKVFDNRKELIVHRRAKHINEISEDLYTIERKDNKTHFICKICKKSCKQKNVLRVHLRSHTGEKPYMCPVCPLRFAQKSQSQKHMKVHNLETIETKTAMSYKCALCQVEFESELVVKSHYDEHHSPTQEKEKIRLLSKPTEWQLCDICGEFRKDITDHLKWHAGKKKYECKICGKILSTRSSLSQHRQRHAVDKKHVCDTCGKSFKIQHCLTLHRRVHFEERKHECHICNRKFLQKVRLRIHLKVHTGEKP